MDDVAVETRELAKRYGRTDALAGLTLTVARGEVFGFLGPNGAGKTTAVKLLLGLARPTGGGGSVRGSDGNRVTSRTGSRERMTARSMACSSSLTLPGHG